ncbi:hypothetical protein KBC04_03190 [Candidatus Babeliales bacterium]|nr:hypothetical protein [Candidatus Babeliales bacterium]MBP9843944.1 hypothetical protein [Candidatus Babeliales bacterium]
MRTNSFTAVSLDKFPEAMDEILRQEPICSRATRASKIDLLVEQFKKRAPDSDCDNIAKAIVVLRLAQAEEDFEIGKENKFA